MKRLLWTTVLLGLGLLLLALSIAHILSSWWVTAWWVVVAALAIVIQRRQRDTGRR